MTDKLFDEKTLRKLERLALIASRVRAGQMKGERRSVRRGTSIEFDDYRNYVRGDDLRRVDWNVFARLDKPFIKLFEEEEDLAVHLLLDASGSMDWPRDSGEDNAKDHHKFRFGQRVVAGLGYVSLGSGDRLTVAALGGPRNTYVWGPLRGKGYSLNLLNFMADLSATNAIDLNAALKSYANRGARPGLCIIVSDLMSPNGFQDGLSALQSRGHEVALVHVLSPDEVNPLLTGDLQLVDVETGSPQDVSIDSSMRELYINRLLSWRDEINAYCTRRGIHYITVETGTPWEELILYELRRLGVVQ